MQDRLDGSSVPQQHLIQDNCVCSNGHASGSKHWKGSWNWDSLSFSAQCTTVQSNTLHSTTSLKSLTDCHLKLSSPVELSMPNSDSVALSLGLKNPSSEGDGLLDLKLGGKNYTFSGVELTPSVKRSRHSPPEIQHPRCQVDNCMADLKDAKDYHRRHKVCEVHAKALKAPVLRIMQRFCQQCSRFHSLQEFDEDRRSCRRRLAGHNRRRRKSQPDAVAALACLLADQNSLGRLVNLSSQDKGRMELESLLGLLASGDALLPALLRAATATTTRSNVLGGSTSDFVNGYATSQVLNLLLSNPSFVSKLESVVTNDSSVSALASALLQNLQQYSRAGLHEDPVPCTIEDDTNLANPNVVVDEQQQYHSGLNYGHIPGSPSSFPVLHQEHILRHESRSRTSNIEVNEGGHLNQSHSFRHEQGNAQLPVSNVNMQPEPGAVHYRELSREYMGVERNIAEGIDSPTQGSGESSNLGLDKQEQTFQIWFKLFDRGPEDLPSNLRNQMLEWLDHHPSEMEGFIRPGCIILTLYVRLPLIAWRNLCNNIERYLRKLADCAFWRNGHVVLQLGDASASIIEGNVVPYASPLSKQAPYLLLVCPFAVTIGESPNFIFKGYNLKADNNKVIFAYDGKSVEKDVSLLGACERKREGDEEEGTDNINQVEALTFNVGPFNSMGHGFIEVEGQASRGNVFPFVVAEKPVCEEVNLLEEEIEKSFLDKSSTVCVKASKSIQFIYELGWLFERSKWKRSHNGVKIKEFSPARYRWLLWFAVDHDWHAVVKKILDILFDTDDEYSDLHSYKKALEVLSETHLLHIAVRKNSRSMVEELSAFNPTMEWASMQKHYIFRPDSPGPGGLTPLHIAASMHDAIGVLDALTNFPEELWASTWTSCKDSVGQTPLAYALETDNLAYVQLVQEKLQRTKSSEEQARGSVKDEPAHTSVIIMPTVANKVLAPDRALKSKCLPCKCSSQDFIAHSHGLPLKIYGLNGPVYRPFVLSMLAIAAVCVCVGLLMKGPPNVNCAPSPFVWEKIGFGFI